MRTAYQKAYIKEFGGKAVSTKEWEDHFWCVLLCGAAFCGVTCRLVKLWLTGRGSQVLLEPVPGEGEDLEGEG